MSAMEAIGSVLAVAGAAGICAWAGGTHRSDGRRRPALTALGLVSAVNLATGTLLLWLVIR